MRIQITLENLLYRLERKKSEFDNVSRWSLLGLWQKAGNSHKSYIFIHRLGNTFQKCATFVKVISFETWK
jgi:hypothetical protein